MNHTEFEDFKKRIWDYYSQNKRVLPWRETKDPYKIYISEMMLQQTQVERVVPKYLAFIQSFRDFKTLTKSPFSKIQSMWNGLGYNRRALYIYKTATIIYEKWSGDLPQDKEALCTLPGIGPYTAGAIQAFAFNKRSVFIETNIRRVYIHSFFQNKAKISDQELNPIIEATLPKDNYREWYYALMDYGAYLSKSQENANKRSKHYTLQSKFEGSRRQLRGKLLRVSLQTGKIDFTHPEFAGYEKSYILDVWNDLVREGLVDPTSRGID